MYCLDLQANGIVWQNVNDVCVLDRSWCDGGRRHVCGALRHSSLTDDYGNFVVTRYDCDCPADPEPTTVGAGAGVAAGVVGPEIAAPLTPLTPLTPAYVLPYWNTENL